MLERLISMFIKKEDFEKFEHFIVIRNDTSGTTIPKWPDVNLIHLQTDGVHLELPINSCKENHMLSLFIFESPPPGKVTIPLAGKVKGAFEVIGKVSAITPTQDAKRCAIELKFTQYDQAAWNDILIKYQKHQERINELTKQGRG